MKKLMTIFGAFFLASVVLTSCGPVSVEDLDKGIESEEDALDAMMIILKAEIEQNKEAMGPYQELADMKDRGEDISDSKKEIMEKVRDEKWDKDDLEKADNWDEYEDLKDEKEDLEDELMKMRM